MFSIGSDLNVEVVDWADDYEHIVPFDGKYLDCVSRGGSGNCSVYPSPDMVAWLNLIITPGRVCFKPKRMKLTRASADLSGYVFEMCFDDAEVALRFKMRFGYYPQPPRDEAF